MSAYILRRLLLFIPTLLGIIIVSFAIIQVLPGGPVEQAMQRLYGDSAAPSGEVSSAVSPTKASADMAQEQIEYLEKLYGYDKPVAERFIVWVKRLFTFDFGESYYYHQDVIDIIADKIPVSASLGIFSFLITYLISIPLGIAKALKDGSGFDLWTSALIFLGYSIPGFVLGVVLIVFFAGGNFFDWFPLRGLVSDNFEDLSTGQKIVDYFHHLALPLICLTIGSFAVMTSLTKNSFLDNIQKQYVVTARAKGLSEKVIVWKHVFRNSMIPLVTGFAGSFLGMFFTGSLLIETLFSLDGLGLLSYTAVIQRDYPIVMANLFLFSLLFLVGNLLADLAYVLVDPRIDFTKK